MSVLVVDMKIRRFLSYSPKSQQFTCQPTVNFCQLTQSQTKCKSLKNRVLSLECVNPLWLTRVDTMSTIVNQLS